ncbi:MAG: MATE family efflux transporter [Desulfovibrio sp.]|jgi:MATE family multidrug resistance protein|nr:MATE family efflux transporter [Desulfovibrio sp.]
MPSDISAASPVLPATKDGQGRVSSREIWSLVWPQALMMMMQFLVGFTDVFVAGRISPHLQGILGIITQCQFCLLVLGMAVVNGGLAAMSQSLGARLPLRTRRYVGLLFKLSATFCLLTLGFGLILQRQILGALHVPEEIFPLTLELWELYLGAMPASYLAFTTTAVFRAHKQVGVPLISILLVCIINTLGDFGLGLGMFGMPDMGGRGLVWASILSVSAGALFNLAVLVSRRMVTAGSFAPWRWEKRAVPYIVRVALPAGCSQFLWQLGHLALIFITATLPENSVSAVAGLTAGMRVESFLFLPAMSFSFTGSILVGRCLGAGNLSEAKRVGLRVVSAGALSMTLTALALLPFVREIAAFVSPESTAVQEVSASYMTYNFLATPCTMVSMIMSGIFTGAGATYFSLITFSCSTWLLRLPLAWYMGHTVWRAAAGVFIAMPISQFVQASLCIYLFLYRDWYRFSSTAKRFRRSSGAATRTFVK